MERSEGLSPDQAKFVERSVKAYRQALDRGERPAVERFLEQTQNGTLKRELLKALLCVDWDVERQQGGKPAVDAYLTQYSEHSESVADAYKQWREQNPRAATTPGAAATISMPAPAAPGSAPTASTAVTCYYLRHGVPIGPFTWAQLMQLARAGDLRPKDQVRLGGSGDWQEAGQINGLFASSTENKGKELRPGEIIRPDYMLLELIGRGGMGDVYKVFRISLKREYALKIIRQDRFRTLSPEMKQDQVERFQKEMQTTARLKHDHIVAVHDTGEHLGLPFYTMDFVDTSLAQKLRHGPLEPRLAAELVAKAARGVHHAHGEGIIHRDIKPHNILLDRDKPLLADLGLAAALEVLQGKGSGEIAGTAAYMAPEQASGGAVDARTDVYGLGATLYHLVTSRPPHQASDRRQILDQVRSADPVPPRQLNPAVDRNLEAVILKSLEKLPERRYATAGQLADDLDRFLKGYTVNATIPSMFERVGKWARREPIKAILACSIVGLVGMLFMMLGVLYFVQSIGNSQLRAALAETEAAKEKAEEHQRTAEDARAKADLERVRADAEKKNASALASILAIRVLNRMKPPDDPLRVIEDSRKQVDWDLRHLDKADEATANGIKLDLADNYRAIALLLMQTAPKERLLEAIQLLGKCVQLQAELAETLPILKFDMSLNYIELAGWYARNEQLDKERETDQKALLILQDLRKAGYNEPSIRAAVGEAHLMLGFDYVKQGRPKTARFHQSEAVRILDELVAGKTDSFSAHAYQQKLGRAYQQLADNLDLSNPAEAIVLLEKAEKIFTDKNQYRRDLAAVQRDLGRMLTRNNQPDQALESLQKADALVEQMIKEAPTSKDSSDSLATLKAEIVTAQGVAHEKKGAFAEAEVYHKRSLNAREKIGNDRSVVNGCVQLSECYAAQEKWTDALDVLQRAIPLQEKLVADHPKTSFTLRRMAGHLHYQKGFYLKKLQKWDDARAACQLAKAHEIEAFVLTNGSPEYGKNLLMTFQLITEILNAEKKTDEIGRVRLERDKLWWTMAEKLAKSYQGAERDAKLLELVEFFADALERRLLDKARLQTEPAFQELRTRPEFNDLLR